MDEITKILGKYGLKLDEGKISGQEKKKLKENTSTAIEYLYRIQGYGSKIKLEDIQKLRKEFNIGSRYDLLMEVHQDRLGAKISLGPMTDALPFNFSLTLKQTERGIERKIRNYLMENPERVGIKSGEYKMRRLFGEEEMIKETKHKLHNETIEFIKDMEIINRENEFEKILGEL
jgi:hypothetical protein